VPQVAAVATSGKAQRRQRGTGAAKRSRQLAQILPRPQARQTAHTLGPRDATA